MTSTLWTVLALSIVVLLAFNSTSGAVAEEGGYYISSVPNCADSNFWRGRDQDSHTTTANDARWSLFRDGDFMIQGILPLASETTSCKIIEKLGLLSVFAMQFAIDKINNDSVILPGYQLGYQIDNACYSIPTVMARGIETVSQYRPQSVCKTTRTCTTVSQNAQQSLRPITAVIGTQSSYTSIPLASLLAMYEIPHVSPAASSRLLSKKSLYSSFLRTTPSDIDQALVISDMLVHFKWSYVYAIGSDDNYGKLGISTMKEYSVTMGFCIVGEDYITNMQKDMESQAKLIALRLKQLPNAVVIVVFAYDNQIRLIMIEVQKLGLKRVWVMSDAFDLFSANKAGIKESSLRGIFRASPMNRLIPGFKEYIRKKIEREAQCNRFLQIYMQQQFHCVINDSAVSCPTRTLDSMASDITSYSNFVFGHIVDALDATANALRSTLREMCNFTTAQCVKRDCPPYKDVNPEMLTKQLFAVNFTTFYNTTFVFNKDGDPMNSHYYIDNVQKVKSGYQFVNVGLWDLTKRLKIHDGDIHWPTWWTHDDNVNNLPPRSTCNADCIPGEYVAAKTECCWSCQACKTNYVSAISNAPNCTKCPDGFSANKLGTECKKNILTILTPSTPAGISIIIINSLGILFTAALYIGYHAHLKPYIKLLPQHHYMALVQLILCFVYGNLLMLDRSEDYCNVTGILSSLLFSGFGVLLMAKTHFFIKYVRRFIQPIFRASFTWSHCITMTVLMLVHVTIIAVCFVKQPLVMNYKVKETGEILLNCYNNMNVFQFIAVLCYPLFYFIIATILAFRERGNEQCHSDAKYLNFTAIAMCIVVVAFLPTFRFVSGIYKSIVLAFAFDVFAFTYIGCLRIPRLYRVMKSTINGAESAINGAELTTNGAESTADGVELTKKHSNDLAKTDT
eukprot:gene11858-13091_t